MTNWRQRRPVLRCLAAALSLTVLVLILAASGPADAGSSGPDVAAIYLLDTVNKGGDGTFRGYAIGATACNVGTQPVQWCDNAGGCGLGTTPADHPVIAQNMYRLKDGRFDQIGASWLKHGFASANFPDAGCGAACINPPLGLNQLGLGCIDTYNANTNAFRPLGRRSEVNAATGVFPMPPGGGGSLTNEYDQRLKVLQADLEPFPTSTRYFVEGHFVTQDDALAGNGLNNAAFREVAVLAGSFNLSFLANTVREQAAIEVWPVIDPGVELVDVDTPSFPAERFHAARKVTAVGPGLWHYEYAVHNMNSDRAADGFRVRFSGPTTFSAAGFHDVDAHSGEPYDTTDWPSSTIADSVVWTAPAFTPAGNRNALRWGTLYNFWFDADRPPTDVVSHSLRLFKAGFPGQLQFLSGGLFVFADGFESGDSGAWTFETPP